MTNEHFGPDEPFDPAQRGYGRQRLDQPQTYISPGARPRDISGQPIEQDDEFDPVRAGYEAKPSIGEKALAAGEAGLREGAPLAAGVQAGMASLKLTTPTMNPWIMGAGFLSSGAAAYYATDSAARGIGLRSASQMPERLRPSGYFGESLGASAALMAAPYTGAAYNIKLGPSLVGNFFNAAVNFARTNPRGLALAEGLPAVSAAGGAYLAETVSPGNTMFRVGAEVGFGILNPSRVIEFGYDRTKALVGYAAGTMNQQNVQNRSWEWIRDTLEEAGENPEVFLRILRENNIVDPASATAAQITGSPAAAAIESHLAGISPNFKRGQAQKLEQTLDALRFKIVGLEKAAVESSTPEGMKTALKLAAEVRYEYTNTLISARVSRANDDATEAVRQLLGKNPDATASEISVVARNALDDSLRSVRQVETELWEKVASPDAFSTTNLRAAVDDIYNRSAIELQDEKIPAKVLSLLERSGANEVPVTLTDLKDFRGWLLENSRTAAQAGRNAEATRLGQLAKAVLDDIDSVMVSAGNRAYDEARMFSRQLNDVFTRSYAGKAVAVGRYGDRIPPEMLLRRATAGGDEQVVLQLEDLSRATRFLEDININKALTADNIRDMNDAQEQFVRLLATSSFDKKTKLVDVNALQRFAKNRPELLARFPAVKADIDDAIKGGESLLRWQATADRLHGIVKNRPMTQIMGSNATQVASRAIASPNREAELAKLVKFAKGGATSKRGVQVVTPEAAMADLRQSVIQSVVGKSSPVVRDRGNVLDIGQFRSMMFDATPTGQRPLVDVLVEQGVFDQSHVANMRKITGAFDAAMQTTAPPTAIRQQTTMLDRGVRAVTKVLGSWLGAGTRQVTGGPGNIILATEGSNLAQDILLRMPAANTMAMVEQLMANPEMLQMVANRAFTPAQQRENVGRFYSWLIQSGLTEGIEQMRDPTYMQEPEAPELFTQPR